MKIQLFIRTQTDGTYTLEVDTSDSVLLIKQKLQDNARGKIVNIGANMSFDAICELIEKEDIYQEMMQKCKPVSSKIEINENHAIDIPSYWRITATTRAIKPKNNKMDSNSMNYNSNSNDVDLKEQEMQESASSVKIHFGRFQPVQYTRHKVSKKQEMIKYRENILCSAIYDASDDCIFYEMKVGRYNVAAHEQKLVYKGVLLNDSKSLAHYKIVDQSSLDLVDN